MTSKSQRASTASGVVIFPRPWALLAAGIDVNRDLGTAGVRRIGVSVDDPELDPATCGCLERETEFNVGTAEDDRVFARRAGLAKLRS
jgi:hypothetical protein